MPDMPIEYEDISGNFHCWDIDEEMTEEEWEAFYNNRYNEGFGGD